MVQDWRSQPSPPPQHPYPTQTPPVTISSGQQEISLRRPSDSRNPGPYGLALTNTRPQLLPQHVVDAMPYSTNKPINQLKRSASRSPPTTYGQNSRPPPSVSTNGINGRAIGMNTHANGTIVELPNASRGNGPISLSNGIGPSLTHGGTGNDSNRGSVVAKYGNGSRWNTGEVTASAAGPGTLYNENPSGYSGSVNGMMGDGPGSGTELGRGSAESGGGSGGNAVGLGVVNGLAGNGSTSGSRNLPSLMDSSGHSLPSLKDSGLLDSWGSPRNGGALEAQKQSPNGATLQQQQQGVTTSPRRSSPSTGPNITLALPSVQHHTIHSRVQPDSVDLRQAMPVGLPWLANESR